MTISLSKAAKLNETSFTKDYEVIQMAQRNPSLGIRKLAKCFNCGKTQLCNILKNKVDKYKNDASSDSKRSLKRSRTSQFVEINDLLYISGSS